MGIITLGCVCLVGCASPLFLAWLRSPEMVPSFALLAPIAAFMVITGWLVVPEAFLVQSGNHRGLAVCSTVEVVLKLSLSALLTFQYGLPGIAVGALIARSATVAWFTPLAYAKQSGSSLRDFWRAVAEASLLPSIAFTAGYLSAKLLWPAANSAWQVFACTAAGATCFLLCYAAVGLPSELRWGRFIHAFRRK